jgi:hypothetical protein
MNAATQDRREGIWEQTYTLAMRTGGKTPEQCIAAANEAVHAFDSGTTPVATTAAVAAVANEAADLANKAKMLGATK